MIRNVSDLGMFRRFLKLAAGRVGQLMDLSSLGADVGITHNTARDWIGVLEAGFIAFRVAPYFKNFSKRLIKSSKLYFYDTGVLCRLLGVREAAELVQHPQRGSIFENWCVVESMKWYLNRGESPELYFWRDQQTKVDLLLSLSSGALAVLECKSSMTPVSEFLDSPKKFKGFAKSVNVFPGAVYGGEATQSRSDGPILSWRHFITAVAEMANTPS